jgi:uncharacterized protein YxeA
MKKIILLIIVLAAGITIGIYFQRQPKAEKIETQVQTDAAQASADVKEGAQKVETVATNVAEHVEAGAQKAGEVATNVVGDVKADAQKIDQAATNAAGEIKQKMP